MSQKNTKDLNTTSIPVYFNNLNNSNKNLLVGKVKLTSDKSTYKVQSKASQIPGIQEYNLISDTNQYFQYTGRENVQDSYYILMKYNSKDNEIMMYPANNWVNFFKSSKKKEIKQINPPKDKDKDKGKDNKTKEKAKDNAINQKEKEMKDKIKKKNKILNDHFSFSTEFAIEEKKKEKKKKKNDIMIYNKEEELLERNEPKKEALKEFDEDSHSSEDEIFLDYDDNDEEIEKDKKEKEEKRKKEEEKEKKKKEENEEEEEEEEEEDKSLNNNEGDDIFMEQVDDLLRLGQKRRRENSPGYDLEEKLENLLRKKSKMTEDEIVTELKKDFKNEEIENYLETALDNIASSFPENEETYYYLKK